MSLLQMQADNERAFAAMRQLKTPLTEHRIGDSRSDGTLFGFIGARKQRAQYGNAFQNFDWSDIFQLLAEIVLDPEDSRASAQKLLTEIQSIRSKCTAMATDFAEFEKTFETLDVALAKINQSVRARLDEANASTNATDKAVVA